MWGLVLDPIKMPLLFLILLPLAALLVAFLVGTHPRDQRRDKSKPPRKDTK